MQTALGSGPLEAGLRLLPWTATLFFVAPVAGTLVDRFGERPFLVAGPLLQAIGMAWIAMIADAGMAYSEMIAPLIIAGAGISMTFPAAQNSVVGSVPAEAIGKAAGMNSTVRELGGVFGIALSVAVFAGAGSYASPQAFSDGFVAAIGVSAALSLLGAIAGLGLPRRPKATGSPRLPQPVPALQTNGTRCTTSTIRKDTPCPNVRPSTPGPGPSTPDSTRPSSSKGTSGSSSAAARTRWTPTAPPSIRATWPRSSSWPSTTWRPSWPPPA
jgi:MFS family permease